MKCKCGCGKKIVTKNYHKYRGTSIFILGHNNRKTPYPIKEYKINKKTGCWEWQLAISSSGYGGKYDNSRGNNVTAHRYYYEKKWGRVSSKLDICHTCDNRLCVNPKHLFVGTRKQNMQDAAKKGRMSKKLSLDDIWCIKFFLEEGTSGAEIGKMFGVSKTQVSYIKRGKQWRYA